MTVEEKGSGQYFGDIMARRLERRDFLKGAGALGAALLVAPPLAIAGADKRGVSPQFLDGADPGKRIQFRPIAPAFDDVVEVAENYDIDVVIRWGDPIHPDAEPFDLANQTASAQEKQFGFNCDFLTPMPLPSFIESSVARSGRPSRRALFRLGYQFESLWRRSSRRMLLWVNHEYTTGIDMFPGYNGSSPTEEQVGTEIMAHGGTVLGIVRGEDGSWTFDIDSPFNRRITGYTTMRLSGPLAGNDLVKTSADPDGLAVQGMFNNCGGGITPWGTILTAEENFDQYFGNFAGLTDPVKKALYQTLPPPNGLSGRKWEQFDSRFDVAQEPNEYARFGFIVEVDPYDPTSTPVKRTALGRFAHEAAVPATTRDGRVALYMGDDARFQHAYKFVSTGRFSNLNRSGNQALLDEGTLYAAKFHVDGTGEWLPLVQGQGPLTEANGFPTQAEVLINTRGAALLSGATRMDRPEDVEVSPITGKVYIALTNNTARTTVAADPGEVEANPRLSNAWGHIVEITESAGDAGALTFSWEIFLLCGDPAEAAHGVYFAGFPPEEVSAIANPDNLDFDDAGNLWIATDGQPFARDFGQNDGVFAVPTEGRDRGFLRQFLSGVPNGEVASLKISGDQKSLFVSIQHPAEGTGLANPSSRWPDGDFPRPSVIAVRHRDGKKIGSL